MKVLFVFFLVFVITVPVLAQSAAINWTTTHQTMDGWGGSTGYAAQNVNLTTTAADLFFTTTSGIGLEWIRTNNTSDGSKPDLPSLQAAVSRGAKVIVSMLGAPASMTSDGTFAHQSGHLPPANYAAFATYCRQWVQYLNANGATVSAFSPTNEPNTQMYWDGPTLATFIGQNLGPEFANNGLSNVAIVMPESDNWFTTDYITPCMNNSACASYVTIAGGHGYSRGTVDGTGVSYCCQTATAAPLSLGSRRVWMTEVNGGFTQEVAPYDTNMWVYDPSIADAMVWAHNIHDFLTVANASAWMYWNLASYSQNEYNDGLTDYNFNPAKRFYAVGNWSKFVRSGWIRIDATPNPANGIYLTAFKEDSSGNFAIVAINQNSTAVNLAVSLTGFPALTSVTPTLTSESTNLEDQANVNLSGGSFSYSLPATSVVTFHGTASSSSSKNVAPPTNLVLAVH
jgi:glucuronoarabinoxylan endo-1,4-beta-xylanase